MFDAQERAAELRKTADTLMSPLVPLEWLNKEHLGKPIALLCRTLADLCEHIGQETKIDTELVEEVQAKRGPGRPRTKTVTHG